MRTRNIRLLGWFNFFQDSRFFAAVFVIYFAQVSGSYALALSVLSITMVAAGLLELPTGVLSDALGRKPLLIAGAALSLAALAAYAAAPSYLVLAWGGVLEGASRACFSGNNEAFLYDNLAAAAREDEFAHHLGRISSMSQAALAACALVGSAIAAATSLRAVMWLSVVPQMALLALSFWFIEPARRRHASRDVGGALRLFWKNRRMRLVGGWSMTGFALGESGFEFTQVFVGGLWPLWALGIWSTLAHAGAFLSYRLGGRLVPRGREEPMLLLGKAWEWLCNLPALLLPTVASPILLDLTSLTYGPTNVAVETLLQREFTDQQRATLGSINSLGGSLLFGMASVALGLFADRLGPRDGLLALQAVSVARLWFLWRLSRLRIG